MEVYSIIIKLFLLLTIIIRSEACPEREVCDGLKLHSFIGTTETKQDFLQAMSNDFCGCRIVDGSININRPGDEVYSSTDFEFLSSVEEIGDTLFIQNLNLTDNITLPNLRLIRGHNLLQYMLDPMENPALFIHNVTGPVYLPQLTEITSGDVYIVSVSFCNHRGVLWEDILTEPGSHYEDIGNDHCPPVSATINSNCSRCVYRHCWSPDLCQTLTKNFNTCSTDCSNRRCYLSTQSNPQCCNRECAAGCTGPHDDQCIACENFNNNGTCVANCPPREVYNPQTAQFKPNNNFKFQFSSLCVESCPNDYFEQGTFCVNECQVGFQPVGRVCEPCPDGVCVGGRTCRGLEDTDPLLPGDVSRFSDCDIVNGNLNFDANTYDEFTDENAAFNLSQARMFLSDIEVVLGQLVITNWGGTVFDYLPNLMYIGGFEGNSSLTFNNALFITDNDDLRQVHFPRLVEVPVGNVALYNNPNLCLIGNLEYYFKSPNQTATYATPLDLSDMRQKAYSECVAEGMSCHHQCNETYRCWGPADTDCVVCNVYLYRNGSECICVDSCDSPRLNLLSSFLYADNSTMTCRACHEECNDSCSGPEPTDCFGRCKNFALPTADNTITCVEECPIGTYVNISNKFCLPCNEVCVPQTGCTGPSDRLESGGCNCCDFVHRDQNLSQISCLPDNACTSGTYLNFPFDPIEPYPFPTRFCDDCHEQCQPCNASFGPCTTCNGPGPTSCLECKFALRGGQCVSSCEDREYVSAKRCLLCHEECDGCTGGSQLDCIACNNVTNILGNGSKFECLPTGGCPNNTFENTMNLTCDQCHPNCAECIGSGFENCTRCNNPPGYTIIPSEGDDPGVFGCCDNNSMAVEQSCAQIRSNPAGRSEETQVGALIGGTLGGSVSIFIFIILVLITFYKCCNMKEFNKNSVDFVHRYDNVTEPPKATSNQTHVQLLIIPKAALEAEKELGSGAFGTVYKGYWQPEGDNNRRIVAIKVLNENTSTNEIDFLQEGVTMASTDCEYTVRLLGVCLGLGTRIMLVSEFVPGGSLYNHLKMYQCDLTANVLLTFVAQIASGMKYLESVRMIHRDLAARNVLVQGPEHVKITDFGLTKILDVGETTFKSARGKVPVRWLAPECLRHRLYTHKSDVWAYGVTVWEILTFSARPYSNLTPRELLGGLYNGVKLEQPVTCSSELYNVLLECWLLDDTFRSSFSDLESNMKMFSTNPTQYIYTVADGSLENYTGLPASSEESHYEYAYSHQEIDTAGYLKPTALNTENAGYAVIKDNDVTNPEGNVDNADNNNYLELFAN